MFVKNKKHFWQHFHDIKSQRRKEKKTRKDKKKKLQAKISDEYRCKN